MKKLLLFAISVLLTQNALAQTPVLQETYDISAARGLTTSGKNVAGRGLGAHIFNWSVQAGAFSACTLSIQTSPNNTTWTTQATEDCTSGGTSNYLLFVANFIRISATTFTPTGSTIALVTVVYNGYIIPPTDIATLTVSPLTNQNISNILYVNNFSGVTWGAQAISCLSALVTLNTAGGTCLDTSTGAKGVTSTVTIGTGQSLEFATSPTLTCEATTACFNLAGEGAELKGLINGNPVITTNTTGASYPIILFTANNTKVANVSLFSTVPSGSEGGSLAAINLSKSSAQLTDIEINDVYIFGANAGIYGDTAIPLGISRVKIHHNKIRTLHFGIIIGPFAGGNINDTCDISDNNIQVTALGSYSGFEFARPLQMFNCSNASITDNWSSGGFNSLEVLGNHGNPSDSRPHMHDVIIARNHLDSFSTMAQVDHGSYSNNIIDMSFRNAAWPTYNNATVVAQWGHLPCLEMADNTYINISGNNCKDPVGLGIDFGQCFYCNLYGNTVYNTGTGTSLAVYEKACIELTYNSNYVSIHDNSLNNCKGKGINQTTREAYSNLVAVNITHNIMNNIQEDGIRIYNTGGGTILKDNQIYNSNLAASTYNGITIAQNAGSGSVTGLTVTSNIISGGTYAIVNTTTVAADNRLNTFKDNISINPSSGKSYNILGGHVSGNWDPALAIGITETVSGGHLSLARAVDRIYVASGTIAYLDYGTIGRTVTVSMTTGGVVFTQAVNRMELAGTVNYSPTSGSNVTLICNQDATATDEAWSEVGRMLR